jgi:hypothetical protein
MEGADDLSVVTTGTAAPRNTLSGAEIFAGAHGL